MRKLFIGLFLLSAFYISAYAHKDFLTGNWRVTKMEPENQDIDIRTLLALGLGADQTISEVRIDHATATFLNSKQETLARCPYTYQSGDSRIVLSQFPAPNSFSGNEQDQTLILHVSGFRYQFSKAK